MTTSRRILFAKRAALKLTVSVTVAAALQMSVQISLLTSAHATTTKVGNGDDGADLEALTPITAGPIFDARSKAVETVKALNVKGIPGLGLLIPELERSDLMMAAQDAHPTGELPGTSEVSDDAQLVFARTFAEPYAATRFFPAAKTLSEQQLIALHIHEALHRSLPENIRTDENIVMHITMSLTSPGATYDRARSVAAMYVRTAPTAITIAANSVEKIESTKPVTLPPSSKSSLGYELNIFPSERLGIGFIEAVHQLEFNTSLGGYKALGSLAVEPNLRIRTKTPNYQGGFLSGPTSFDLQGKIRGDENTDYIPYTRYTLKPVTSREDYYSRGRDILTIGLKLANQTAKNYSDIDLSYSLPSERDADPIFGSKTKFKSILTLNARGGFQRGKFRLGGVAELHSSEGSVAGPTTTENYSDEYGPTDVSSFRIILAGPEIGYVAKSFHIKMYGKWIVVGDQSLDALGDLMDRGTGQGQLGTSMALAF